MRLTNCCNSYFDCSTKCWKQVPARRLGSGSACAAGIASWRAGSRQCGSARACGVLGILGGFRHRPSEPPLRASPHRPPADGCCAASSPIIPAGGRASLLALGFAAPAWAALLDVDEEDPDLDLTRGWQRSA